MDRTEAVARRYGGLVAYEWLLAGLGVAAVGVAAVLGAVESFPAAGPLALLCVLSAVASRYESIADDDGLLSASMQSMVVAASLVLFADTSPLLGPLLVGMAAAFWRVPRTRHERFTLLGNLALCGFSALAAAAVFGWLPLGAMPSTLALCVAALPLAVVLAVVNGSLISAYLAVYEGIRLRDAAGQLVPHLPGAYVPFVFGVVVGELSVRFGLVVLGLAAASFVMVQVVFSSYRRLVESEREVLAGLVAAVEEKDPYTAGHSQRVGRYARMIAEPLGWKGKDLARLVQHATMHDIGKLAVPNHILRKPDRFTAVEREIMFRHETTGAAILAEIPFLRSGGDIGLYAFEWGAGVRIRGGDGRVGQVIPPVWSRTRSR